MEDKWYLKYKIAHRGLHSEGIPENSLLAFEEATKYGFAIELDVRILKDGNIVAFHDDNLKRMCDKCANLSDLSIEDLGDITLKGSNEHIPLLQEVLDLVDNKVPIMIELKPEKDCKVFAQKVYEILKKYKGRYAVKSFDPRPLIWFRKNAPKVPRGMLSSDFKNIYVPWFKKVLVKNLFLYSSVKPNFISYDYRALPNKLVSSKKVPVLAWTIRSKMQEERALQYASTVIFENYIPSSIFNF